MHDHVPLGSLPLRGDQDELPQSIIIRSNDLPDVDPPAFYRKALPERIVDSAVWGDEDPEELRAEGPRAVGEALFDLACLGRFSLNRRARLAAALLIEHLGDGLLHDRLALDLGLVPRNGAPDLALIARRSERDRLVLDLARKEPFASMGAWSAAGALRDAVEAYAATRWPREKPPHRSTAPGDDVGGASWRIMRLHLPHGPMPGQAALRRMIEAERTGAR